MNLLFDLKNKHQTKTPAEIESLENELAALKNEHKILTNQDAEFRLRNREAETKLKECLNSLGAPDKRDDRIMVLEAANKQLADKLQIAQAAQDIKKLF